MDVSLADHGLPREHLGPDEHLSLATVHSKHAKSKAEENRRITVFQIEAWYLMYPIIQLPLSI